MFKTNTTTYPFPIPEVVRRYLLEAFSRSSGWISFNRILDEEFRLVEFCLSDVDFQYLQQIVNYQGLDGEKVERKEYGDFQTPDSLIQRTLALIQTDHAQPAVCIEPTCGKGNFILGALQVFPSLQYIYGIEIYKPYLWETKFRLLAYYLEQEVVERPVISLIHADIFWFDFQKMAEKHQQDYILLLGNPPWVTNAQLSRLGSENLPPKSNFKNLKGLAAITGKSNFDLAEKILLKLCSHFQNHTGSLAFLVKNAVVKNLIEGSKQHPLPIENCRQYHFDAQKEFGVGTRAAAFLAKLNGIGEPQCQVKDLYHPVGPGRCFGWVGDQFVSDISAYQKVCQYDGTFPFVWRSGIKHDCSKVFELRKIRSTIYKNKSDEVLELEEELLFSLVKSSHVKKDVITSSENYVIVTQKNLGAPTDYLEANYPLTYRYLQRNYQLLENRKSAIYRRRPPFSIFGVGDYTFKKYKVAISGLYKEAHFALLAPEFGKPMVTDDTCYTIGFTDLKPAVFCAVLLNSVECRQFLAAICFSDAKRVYTKSILMRIDLLQLLLAQDPDALVNSVNQKILKMNYQEQVTREDVARFQELLTCV